MVFCTSCGFEVTDESSKFCPKCGTTTFQDSKKTDSVANHTSNNSSIISTERSKLWYLLAIIFGIVGTYEGFFFIAIIGGLIAYLVLRKSDSRKAKRCLIIGIVFALLALAVGIGMYGNLLVELTETDDNTTYKKIEVSEQDRIYFTQMMQNREAFGEHLFDKLFDKRWERTVLDDAFCLSYSGMTCQESDETAYERYYEKIYGNYGNVNMISETFRINDYPRNHVNLELFEFESNEKSEDFFEKMLKNFMKDPPLAITDKVKLSDWLKTQYGVNENCEVIITENELNYLTESAATVCLKDNFVFKLYHPSSAYPSYAKNLADYLNSGLDR